MGSPTGEFGDDVVGVVNPLPHLHRHRIELSPQEIGTLVPSVCVCNIYIHKVIMLKPVFALLTNKNKLLKIV